MSDLDGVPDKASRYRDFNASLFLISTAVNPCHSERSSLQFLTPSHSTSFWISPIPTCPAHLSLSPSRASVFLFLFPPCPLNLFSVSIPVFDSFTFSVSCSAFIKYIYTENTDNLPLDYGQKIYSCPGEAFNQISVHCRSNDDLEGFFQS